MRSMKTQRTGAVAIHMAQAELLSPFFTLSQECLLTLCQCGNGYNLSLNHTRGAFLNRANEQQQCHCVFTENENDVGVRDQIWDSL